MAPIGAPVADGAPILYLLVDLPSEAAPFLRAFLPRLRDAWSLPELVQIRAKATPARAFVEAVEAVLDAARTEAGESARVERGPGGLRRSGRGGRPAVLVNDRADVALAAGADGVHVGADDLPPASVRELPGGAELLVGATCHTLEELRAAPATGADYAAAGAFFPSPTKPAVDSDPRVPLAALDFGHPLPVLAIGGITAARAPSVLRTPHVRGVVVSSAVQEAPDPAAALREIRAALDRAAGTERLTPLGP
jgi:thiamine-phosphate pyrophosphorylase